MNNKKDILNAWIIIEQLSEGDIKKTDKNLRNLNAWKENQLDNLFQEFMAKQVEELKKSQKRPKKYGVVVYFDIFKFQEIVDFLREELRKELRKEYGISSTYEEISRSEKFTFALYFDKDLQFVSEKMFFTISGYIRYKKKLPMNFQQAEIDLRDDLEKQFEDEEFNQVFIDLLKQYRVSPDNCRYSFIEDLENSDDNLHSFFIDDLKKAQNSESDNLNRYLSSFHGNRHNLDGNKHSQNFNPAILEDILQPKKYPLGRFPTDPKHSLSLMQQVAVNLALDESDSMRGVNGPPGTGKTTILNDIFAELIVQQANFICELSDKHIGESLIYYEKGKIGLLPDELAKKNIVVASSNNGAVQNIVNKLPLQEKISKEFTEKLLEADYFTDIANINFIIKKGEASTKKYEKKRWGLFSLEGGKADNLKKLMLNIESMKNYLDDEYSSDTDVYKDFLELYETVSKERNKAQDFYENIQRLIRLSADNEAAKEKFNREKEQKQQFYKNLEIKLMRQLDDLQKKQTVTEEKQAVVLEELSSLEEEVDQSRLNLKNYELQKPRFFLFKKMLNTADVADYICMIDEETKRMATLKSQKKRVLKKSKEGEQNFKNIVSRRKSIHQRLERETSSFNEWLDFHIKKLNNLKKQIERLEKIKVESPMRGLDFTLSYEKLQEFNPWFTEEFRTMQVELFILALRVKKEFLFENRKSLKGAWNIWKRKNQNFTKEEGPKLVREGWQWINFAVPVISTTFASLRRMFEDFSDNTPPTVGYLFIDEAGQALPQASIGGICRSKRVLALGDPSQIKPVLSLDSNILNLIAKRYHVDETFVSAKASTQTLVDSASQYGFNKSEEEWIGIPLWVHRRCAYPMFTISNEISYGGLMVQGLKKNIQGKSKWFDIAGKARDKFVKEQADFLLSKIAEYPEEEWEEIYVISPFKNVARSLERHLRACGFTKYEKGKAINVGTVHTFQGKETKIVYFVLGADANSRGAATWAVSEANIMNVAATRAKEEFYVIGDKRLYASLASQVSNKAITIIDQYNEKSIQKN